MNRYQTQVIDDKVQLDLQRQKLRDFTHTPECRTLSDRELELITRQLYLMMKFSDILGERIAAFEAAARRTF